MLAKVSSYSLTGIDGYEVYIEIDINAGLPSYDTVGLPDAAVKESRERVRSAIKNSGYNYPLKRITINLAPADTKKEGAVFDLAIAVGLLGASEQLNSGQYGGYVLLGELSLDGGVRRVNGVLPLLITALQNGHKRFIIPKGNANEACYIGGIEVYAVDSLKETVELLRGEKTIQPISYKSYAAADNVNKYNVDFSEVKGQTLAKRAIEIAVAGGHNLIMIGPPGSGKTMLAKCVPTIMPQMSFDEAIEVTKIHSVAGVLDADGIISSRPFRSPHHTATLTSLTGGGINSKPGEISLAHNGVLFLDEMPEYNRKTLETLRQPLEDGRIIVARAKQTLEYPAHFMLIASMNPCPCGNYGSSNECKCTPNEIRKYVNKLSGPLLDRIDLQIEVDNISYDELRRTGNAESSETVKARVDGARDVQRERFAKKTYHTNSEMSAADMRKYCAVDRESEILLENAFRKLNLSARATNRILKVSRTIADLAGAETISSAHIAESIQYRSLDRKYWE